MEKLFLLSVLSNNSLVRMSVVHQMSQAQVCVKGKQAKTIIRFLKHIYIYIQSTLDLMNQLCACYLPLLTF